MSFEGERKDRKEEAMQGLFLKQKEFASSLGRLYVYVEGNRNAELVADDMKTVMDELAVLFLATAGVSHEEWGVFVDKKIADGNAG